MSSRKAITALAFCASLIAGAAPSHAQILTGDTRLACEAVLCLATAQRPSECTASLVRYFGIKFKKPGDTIRERINFLNLCPVADTSPLMASLISAMGAGAGSCDAASLNMALQTVQFGGDDGGARPYISNVLPAVCRAYTQHAYADQGSMAVRYVGSQERGGYWVAAADYDAAQTAWIARIRLEDAAAHSFNQD
jgi:hypothetical protein